MKQLPWLFPFHNITLQSFGCQFSVLLCCLGVTRVHAAVCGDAGGVLISEPLPCLSASAQTLQRLLEGPLCSILIQSPLLIHILRDLTADEAGLVMTSRTAILTLQSPQNSHRMRELLHAQSYQVSRQSIKLGHVQWGHRCWAGGSHWKTCRFFFTRCWGIAEKQFCRKASFLLLGCLEVFKSLEAEETCELQSLLFNLCLECL